MVELELHWRWNKIIELLIRANFLATIKVYNSYTPVIGNALLTENALLALKKLDKFSTSSERTSFEAPCVLLHRNSLPFEWVRMRTRACKCGFVYVFMCVCVSVIGDGHARSHSYALCILYNTQQNRYRSIPSLCVSRQSLFYTNTNRNTKILHKKRNNGRKKEVILGLDVSFSTELQQQIDIFRKTRRLFKSTQSWFGTCSAKWVGRNGFLR